MAASIFPPTITTSILVNTRTQPKIVYLPAVSTVGAGKMYYIKDICGTAGVSSIFLSTTGLDSFDYRFRPSTLYALMSTNFQSVLLAADGQLNWLTLQNYNTNVITRPVTFPANPLILLSPNQTFPSYTTTSAPTFGPTFITFPGTTQFLDFGSQSLPMGTSGFSAKLKLEWTAFQNWSRVFDFNNGSAGANDTFLAFPGTASNPLRFMYKVGGEIITDYGSNFAANTVYNISIVYNPTVGSVGSTSFWVNGSNVLTNISMGAKATDRTNTNTYIGRSSYADAFLAAKIYFLAIYTRPLTNAEAAQIL
jgi:hypothetical protein